MNPSTKIYIELYKRKQYDKIPLGALPNGELFYMTKKQLKAIELLQDETTLFIGYGGSARSGKTVLECFVAIFDCLAYHDIAWGLARKELVNLKRTVLKTLFNSFSFYGIEKDIDYRYNQQLNIITFNNKSDIFLIDSAYKPTDPLYLRFGGYELTRCAHDESNETVHEAIRILFTRTGWRNNIKYGLKRKMLETFNPDKSHVNRRYYKPYKEKKELEHVKFIPALPRDNPHPSVVEWIKDIIREGHKVTIQRLVEGNFEYDDDPATLIDYESITDYWNGKHVQQADDNYLTIDVARKGKDKTVFRVWCGWVCVKRYSMAVSLITEIVAKAEEIQIKYGVSNSNTIADEDGVGGGVVDYLGCKGFVNNSRPIKEEIGENYLTPNYDNLKSQCSIEMAKMITKKKVVELCDDSNVIEITSEEMEQVKIKDVDKDGKLGIIPKDKVKEMIGRSPDEWDSIMMRYYFELQQEDYEIGW